MVILVMISMGQFVKVIDMMYYPFPFSSFQSMAILVMISLGQFVKVIEMMYSMRQCDRAALFVESLKQFGLLDKSEETSILYTQKIFCYL